MKEIFVSAKASTSGDGSENAPFKTVEEAKELAISCNDDVTVIIDEGRYFFKKSLVLQNVCNKKIEFKAKDGKKVYFDGGIVLDWKKAKKVSDKKIKDRIIDKNASEKVLEIDLSEFDIEYAKYGTRGFRRATVPSCNELYVNSVPYNVAQYPNVGEELIPLKKVVDSGSNPYNLEFDMRPATFVYEDSRCDLWKEAKGFYVSGLFTWSFADDTLEIDSIDTNNKTMTTVLPHLPGMVAQPFSRWYAINLLEEIDVPGEYFVDKETQKVYFYPTESIENAFIQLSVLGEPMVVLENCNNVVFCGITFENSRGTGAYIEKGENCCFKDCTFRNLGMVGVQIGQGATALPEGKHNAHGIMADDVENPKGESRIIGSWHEMLYQFPAWNSEGGKNNGVLNCEIYNTGTGGVMLGGGDRKKLIPAGNYVHNCELYNVNRLDRTYKAGVNISGVGNKISNCEIYDMPGFAVYLHGNDHIIEYNKIHDVVKEVADAGAIYWGRDLSEVGNVVRYNFIYNITGLKSKGTLGVCAVYLDDYASFNAVYGNYFYNINQSRKVGPFGVVFWNCGGQTSVNNNIFVDCPAPLCPKENGMRGIGRLIRGEVPSEGENCILHHKRVKTEDINDLGGVDVTSDIWKEKYPYLYEVYAGTYKNEALVWNNVVVNDYSVFKDVENYDFTIVGEELKNEAMMFVYDPLMNVDEERMFFHTADFEKIGRK